MFLSNLHGPSVLLPCSLDLTFVLVSFILFFYFLLSFFSSHVSWTRVSLFSCLLPIFLTFLSFFDVYSLCLCLSHCFLSFVSLLPFLYLLSHHQRSFVFLFFLLFFFPFPQFSLFLFISSTLFFSGSNLFSFFFFSCLLFSCVSLLLALLRRYFSFLFIICFDFLLVFSYTITLQPFCSSPFLCLSSFFVRLFSTRFSISFRCYFSPSFFVLHLLLFEFPFFLPRVLHLFPFLSLSFRFSYSPSLSRHLSFDNSSYHWSVHDCFKNWFPDFSFCHGKIVCMHAHVFVRRETASKHMFVSISAYLRWQSVPVRIGAVRARTYACMGLPVHPVGKGCVWRRRRMHTHSSLSAVGFPLASLSIVCTRCRLHKIS